MPSLQVVAWALARSGDFAARTRTLRLLSSWRDPSPLFDHLVGSGEQRRRHLEAERLRGYQIDDEVELCRLLDGEFAGLRPAQDLVDVYGDASKQVREVRPIRHETSRVCELAPAENCREPHRQRKRTYLNAVGGCKRVSNDVQPLR